MKQVKCKQCGIILDSNIYALNRKLFGRAVKEAICISCMADYFSCDTEDLLIMFWKDPLRNTPE